MKTNKLFRLIAAVILCELAGIIGSIFTLPSIPTWYATLLKPALNPPAWIFGPVWTTLFALMGISLFLVWGKNSSVSERKQGIVLFFVQLALNILWSTIFFGLHNPGAAFIEIMLLWLTILATIATFYKISKIAAWLLIPYIVWVSFAGYLNYAIWQLNVA